MKISMNDKEIFSLSEVQQKVICNDIPSDIFESDCCRRLEYIMQHKYERCMKRLREEWMPKLAKRMDSIPTSDDKFAELVFSQPDYMDRATRDKSNAVVL
jgi:hypothetical protein